MYILDSKMIPSGLIKSTPFFIKIDPIKVLNSISREPKKIDQQKKSRVIDPTKASIVRCLV